MPAKIAKENEILTLDKSRLRIREDWRIGKDILEYKNDLHLSATEV